MQQINLYTKRLGRYDTNNPHTYTPEYRSNNFGKWTMTNQARCKLQDTMIRGCQELSAYATNRSGNSQGISTTPRSRNNQRRFQGLGGLLTPKQASYPLMVPFLISTPFRNLSPFETQHTAAGIDQFSTAYPWRLHPWIRRRCQFMVLDRILLRWRWISTGQEWLVRWNMTVQKVHMTHTRMQLVQDRKLVGRKRGTRQRLWRQKTRSMKKK